MAKNGKKNKDNRRRRLLLLILLLALTLVVTAFSTYAWFTSNKKVNVDDLNVDVRAVNGLEISADAVVWGVKIDKDDLIENNWTGQKNQLPDSLGHVSSAKDLTSAKYLQMFDGAVATECPGGGSDCDNPTYTLTTSSANEIRCYDSKRDGSTNESAVPTCNQHYFMAFDIFLKVDRDNTKLYLTENAGVKNTSTDDLGIKNTTRVAFVVQGNIPSATYRAGQAATPQTGAADAQALQNGTQVVFWEPNYDVHTVAGVQSAQTYYGVTTLSAGAGNNAVAYEGVQAAFSTPIELNKTKSSGGTGYDAYFKAVTIDLLTPASGATRTDTGIVLANGVTKVRVYFWVEGQDVDTENTATGSNMKLDLELSID